MSLTDRPLPVELLRDPFVLTARWQDRETHQVYIAAAPYPGATPSEFAIGPELAGPIVLVEREELPIALQLVRRETGWAFDYLGGPEFFTSKAALAATIHSPPVPQTTAELNAAAQQMLRESIGIGPDQPIPEPAGPLPRAEQPAAPYVFDPAPHMDLETAEAPAPIPPPAPPGPPPAETPRLPAPVPPPAPPKGAFGDQSVPFAH